MVLTSTDWIYSAHNIDYLLLQLLQFKSVINTQTLLHCSCSLSGQAPKLHTS